MINYIRQFQIPSSIRGYLVTCYRTSRNSLIKLLLFLRGTSEEVIYVDPRTIKRTISRFDPALIHRQYRHFGSVSSGDWDLNGYEIKRYGGIYPILKQIFDGNSYDNITLFQDNLSYIEMGGKPDNCRTTDAYREKWKKIEILYNQIKQGGYKNQHELRTGLKFEEIRVQIARNGELLFEEGIHRLVIAQLLQLKCIPVMITRRHSDAVNTDINRMNLAQ